MRKSWVQTAGIVALAIMPSFGQARERITAALSASGGNNSVVMRLGDKRCHLMALVVNEGTAVIDTGALESALYLDGKRIRGVADTFIKASWRVEPGRHQPWGVDLFELVKEPGLHRMIWKGRGFTSNEVRFLLKPRE